MINRWQCYKLRYMITNLLTFDVMDLQWSSFENHLMYELPKFDARVLKKTVKQFSKPFQVNTYMYVVNILNSFNITTQTYTIQYFDHVMLFIFIFILSIKKKYFWRWYTKAEHNTFEFNKKVRLIFFISFSSSYLFEII
jgi:hypothetical protein